MQCVYFHNICIDISVYMLRDRSPPQQEGTGLPSFTQEGSPYSSRAEYSKPRGISLSTSRILGIPTLNLEYIFFGTVLMVNRKDSRCK
jgi:hypothetical protein